MAELLLQPSIANLGDYLGIASERRLKFELIDFTMPEDLFTETRREKLLTLYSRSPVHALHGPYIDLNFVSSEPDIRAISRKRIEQCAGCAVRLGAPRMVVHSCFFPTLPKDSALLAEWSKESAEFLTEIIEKFSIDIYLENVLDISPDIVYMVLSAAGHSRLNACLDVGHAHLSKFPLENWVSMLAPYIRHVHLHDNFGVYDDHLALGNGNIDWEEFDQLIGKYFLQADYTLEVKPLEDEIASVDFILANMPNLCTVLGR